MAAFVVKPAAEPIANIVFKDELGADTSLEKWRGRVVLLNLWATWCAPCRKEMPELDALQQKLGSRRFRGRGPEPRPPGRGDRAQIP